MKKENKHFPWNFLWNSSITSIQTIYVSRPSTNQFKKVEDTIEEALGKPNSLLPCNQSACKPQQNSRTREHYPPEIPCCSFSHLFCHHFLTFFSHFSHPFLTFFWYFWFLFFDDLHKVWGEHSSFPVHDSFPPTFLLLTTQNIKGQRSTQRSSERRWTIITGISTPSC